MSAFWDSDWIYNAEDETRRIERHGSVYDITLRAALWGWLDHFRGEDPLEVFAANMLDEADRGGSTYEMALGVLCMSCFNLYWEKRPELSVFAEVGEEEIEEASFYLPVISDARIAIDTPDEWWRYYAEYDDRPRRRNLNFEGQSRIVALPRRLWAWLDLYTSWRGDDRAIAAYISDADDDPESAARALRALAVSYFEKERKRGLPDGVFDPRFKRELDEAARHLGIVAR